MKKYFGYIRVSTAKQGTHGVSLVEQKSAIERHAAKNSLAVVEWFEERETAAKRGRPVFARMLGLLRRGKAVGVVIHKIDRSARNLKDWADLGELIDSGVEVHFAADALDLNSRGGRLSADIQAVVAADYIRNLREETRKGFYGRLNQGFYPIRAPLGYLDCGGGKAKIPDPERAPLIRFAFSAYASGQYSLDTLGAELFRRGLRNRNEGAVTRNGLSVLLNNPFYAGVIRLRSTGETFAGVHPPLITPHLYDEVQARLKGKLVDRVQTHDFLFRRLLRCATCGRSLIGSQHKGRVYYRCQRGACPTTCEREDAVTGRLREVAAAIELSPQEVGDARLLLGAVFEGDAGKLRERQEAVQLLISGVRAKCDRLTDAFVEGNLPKEAYLERRERLLFDLARLEENLREIDAGRPQDRARANHMLELVKAPVQALDSGSPVEKRTLIEELTSNRVVSGKNVVVELFEPFRSLANLQFVTSGDPYRDKPRTLEAWAKAMIKEEEVRRRERMVARCPLPPPSPPDLEGLPTLAA